MRHLGRPLHRFCSNIKTTQMEGAMSIELSDLKGTKEGGPI